MSEHREHTYPADCTDALRELYACLDGCLTPERRKAIEAHVAHCSCCMHAFQFEARMLAAIREPCADDETVEQLKKKVLAALMEQGFCPENPDRGPSV